MFAIVIIVLIFAIPFYNTSIYKIKKYTEKFEEINSFILKNEINKDLNLLFELEKNLTKFPILKKAIDESKLCSVEHYIQKGIVYKFKCKNNSDDSFLDSEVKYYLIKILNKKTELLSYEQFVDYAKKPIELKNNWYLIEQNITNN
jgi:hypothetical protein